MNKIKHDLIFYLSSSARVDSQDTPYSARKQNKSGGVNCHTNTCNRWTETTWILLFIHSHAGNIFTGCTFFLHASEMQSDATKSPVGVSSIDVVESRYLQCLQYILLFFFPHSLFYFVKFRLHFFFVLNLFSLCLPPLFPSLSPLQFTLVSLPTDTYNLREQPGLSYMHLSLYIFLSFAHFIHLLHRTHSHIFSSCHSEFTALVNC